MFKKCGKGKKVCHSEQNGHESHANTKNEIKCDDCHLFVKEIDLQKHNTPSFRFHNHNNKKVINFVSVIFVSCLLENVMTYTI